MPIWKAERGEGLVGSEDEATLGFVSAETFTLCRQEAEFNAFHIIDQAGNLE